MAIVTGQPYASVETLAALWAKTNAEFRDRLRAITAGHATKILRTRKERLRDLVAGLDA